jgi:hypothetical protein
MIWSMTYVHRRKPKALHYTLISLHLVTIHETPIYRRIVVDKYGNQVNVI